jgi:outer membrane protein OmpA-like peptidoglycan-associated protein
MRGGLVGLAFALLLVAAGAGCQSTQQTTRGAPEQSPSALTSAPPLDFPSPEGSLSPTEASASPIQTESPAPTPTPAPTATPTIPPEPKGLAPGWASQYERNARSPDADLVVRAGDINNLGYGWPAHFTPFSGASTPVHAWPCSPRPGAAAGTDRIMLGTSVTPDTQSKYPGDGYSRCSSRPSNLPQAIALQVGALPRTLHGVYFQMFVDDFQAPVWKSHFQVSLNGTRIPSFEDTIDLMNQTGPIGKLVTLRLLPEYWPLLRSGSVRLLFDDPTTGRPDGYAIDFVRILVNPHGFRYAVSIACSVVDAVTNKAIAGASVSAAQVTAATARDGTSTLRGVPAGIASVGASAVGYDTQTQLADLPAGQHASVHFALKRHRESANSMQSSIAKYGTVAIYGIHFNTASAQIRPESTSALDQMLSLIRHYAAARWIIAGHTDNQGGAVYNTNLSLARAQAVVAWLTKHGVAANRLVAKGYGLTRPVGDNSTAAGRALNRRVEVSLVR